MAGKGRLPRNNHLARTVGQDGRYRLLRLINQGALGSLWEGEDTSLRCPVAVRVLSKAVAAGRGPLRELRARLEAVHERLDHTQVAYVYGYSDRDGPEQYVVMEPMSGETLNRRLHRAGPLHPADALRLAAEIADGLQAAHDVGLAHGGLTAESIVLQGDGSVKLIDFGVAAPPPDPGQGQISDDLSRLQGLLREMVGGTDPAASQLTLDPTVTGASAGQTASALRRAATEAAARRAEETRRAEEAARKAEAAAREKERLRAEHARRTEEAAQMVDDARRAEEAARGEHAHRADQARRAAEAREAAESQREEVVGRAEESAKHAEDARRAEEAARREHAHRADQARRAAEARKAAESRRQRVVGRAEEAAKHAEDARRAEEAARAEHTLRVEEVKEAEEAFRQARAAETELEGEADDADRPTEEPSLTVPEPETLSNDRPGPGAPKPARATRGSGGGPARAQVAAPPTGRVRRPRLGLRPPAGSSLRANGRNWLLGGTTVLLVIVAGTLLVGRIGEEPTPTPPRSGERQTASTLTVPDLQGLTAVEAKGRLTEEGLVLDGVVPVIGPPGVVHDNVPAPGERVAPGTGVVLFIGVEPDRFEEEVPTTP